MPNALDLIRSSVDRLTSVVRPLDDDAVAGPAYPEEWSIADVLSHLGSGSVIWQRRIADGLAGTPTPDDFNQSVWDGWNAKLPRAKVDDAIVAMDAFTSGLEALSADERGRVRISMGPMEFDFATFAGLRLNEHLVHEWDVAVALDDAATLAADGVELVIDNLELTGRYTAKPTGWRGAITVRTSAPERFFTITLDAESVAFAHAEPAGRSDAEMPAESFIRLVYGRLDPVHTPASVTGEAVDILRLVFPGP